MIDRICPGCRAPDGEHVFDNTCTLTECTWCNATGYTPLGVLCRTCGGSGRVEVLRPTCHHGNPEAICGECAAEDGFVFDGKVIAQSEEK